MKLEGGRENGELSFMGSRRQKRHKKWRTFPSSSPPLQSISLMNPWIKSRLRRISISPFRVVRNGKRSNVFGSEWIFSCTDQIIYHVTTDIDTSLSFALLHSKFLSPLPNSRENTKKEEQRGGKCEFRTFLRLKLEMGRQINAKENQREIQRMKRRRNRKDAFQRNHFPNSIQSVSFHSSPLRSNSERERGKRLYRLVTIKLVFSVFSLWNREKWISFHFKSSPPHSSPPSIPHIDSWFQLSIIAFSLHFLVTFCSFESCFVQIPFPSLLHSLCLMCFLCLRSSSKQRMGAVERKMRNGKTLILKEISYKFWFTSNATELVMERENENTKEKESRRNEEKFLKRQQNNNTSLLRIFDQKWGFEGRKRWKRFISELWKIDKERKVEDDASLFWFINLSAGTNPMDV